MVEKRILLAVADPQAGEEFRDALGKQWVVTVVASGTAALAEMKQQPCHVLVADLDLPELDGAALLQQVRKKHPKTIRFILAPESERNQVMKRVLGAHQFLAKPLNKSMLKSALEQAEAANAWIPSGKIRELAGRIRAFPTVPSLYFEIVNLLKSPDATTEEVGELIGKDMAMMTKLLQVINSAYFGLSRRVTEPAEAVGILGFEAVKSVVMAVKLLSQYERLRPAYLSTERLWRHSMDVAQTAKQLAVLATRDRGLAASAFTAGLLHDLGKVVLAANFDEHYSGAHSLARKLQVPLWEIEREVFGASHGEIGAYLFALWGMPPELLEAVALHHNPSRTTGNEFSPLTAVHVANALECEVSSDTEGLVVPEVNKAYLAGIGCLDRLEVWRAAVASRDFTNAELRVRLPENVPAKPAPTAPEPVPAPPPGGPSPKRSRARPPRFRSCSRRDRYRNLPRPCRQWNRICGTSSLWRPRPVKWRPPCRRPKLPRPCQRRNLICRRPKRRVPSGGGVGSTRAQRQPCCCWWWTGWPAASGPANHSLSGPGRRRMPPCLPRDGLWPRKRPRPASHLGLRLRRRQPQSKPGPLPARRPGPWLRRLPPLARLSPTSPLKVRWKSRRKPPPAQLSLGQLPLPRPRTR